MARARALAASRDQFWAGLQRQGKQQGTKAMIEVLLAREYGTQALQQAVTLQGVWRFRCRRGAIAAQCRRRSRAVRQPFEIGALRSYDRPPPTLSNYDQLPSLERGARQCNERTGNALQQATICNYAKHLAANAGGSLRAWRKRPQGEAESRCYLEALLAAESRSANTIPHAALQEAHLPKVKTLRFEFRRRRHLGGAYS
jgi:hypothetical protein